MDERTRQHTELAQQASTCVGQSANTPPPLLPVDTLPQEWFTQLPQPSSISLYDRKWEYNGMSWHFLFGDYCYHIDTIWLNKYWNNYTKQPHLVTTHEHGMKKKENYWWIKSASSKIIWKLNALHPKRVTTRLWAFFQWEIQWSFQEVILLVYKWVFFINKIPSSSRLWATYCYTTCSLHVPLHSHWPP